MRQYTLGPWEKGKPDVTGAISIYKPGAPIEPIGYFWGRKGQGEIDAQLAITGPELVAALEALFSYTIDVLTGPRFEGVTWPDDFPNNHPTLKNAKAALASARHQN